MVINFIFSKDSEETRTVHTKSDNIETITETEANGIIEELFESPLQKYQKGSMKGSELIFDSVDLLYYKLHSIKYK